VRCHSSQIAKAKVLSLAVKTKAMNISVQVKYSYFHGDFSFGKSVAKVEIDKLIGLMVVWLYVRKTQVRGICN